MAVYTLVDDAELIAFLATYDIGDLLSCKGIAEGVENSNYFLHASAGSFILTLYEKRVAEDDHVILAQDNKLRTGFQFELFAYSIRDHNLAF